jgi:hypothetical protein
VATQEVFHPNPGMPLTFDTYASAFEFKKCQSLFQPCKSIDGLIVTISEEGKYSVKGSLKKANSLEKNIEFHEGVDNTPPKMDAHRLGVTESSHKLAFQIPDNGNMGLAVKLSENFTDQNCIHETIERSFSFSTFGFIPRIHLVWIFLFQITG